MIIKQLLYLSDETLISILCKKEDTNPSIDATSFGLFVKTEQAKIRKIQMKHRIILLGFFILFSLSLFLVLKDLLDEGLSGLGIALSLIGALLVHYLVFPKKKRKIEKKEKYEETFLITIQKDGLVNKATQEQVFHALMNRVQMILSFPFLEERKARLKKIILSINETEDYSGKVFRINPHFRGNLGLLKDFFKEEGENDYWLEEFISRHSIQITVAITLKATEKTPEEIISQ